MAPVFTSTGNGWTSAASIDPTLVSAPSRWRLEGSLLSLNLTAEAVLQLVDLDALGGDEDDGGEEYDELHLVL